MKSMRDPPIQTRASITIKTCMQTVSYKWKTQYLSQVCALVVHYDGVQEPCIHYLDYLPLKQIQVHPKRRFFSSPTQIAQSPSMKYTPCWQALHSVSSQGALPHQLPSPVPSTVLSVTPKIQVRQTTSGLSPLCSTTEFQRCVLYTH